MTDQVCRVCGREGCHDEILVKEMMSGTREAFPYFLCKDCGTLQIRRQVDDVSSFYDNDTYSSFRDVQVGFVRRYIAPIRNRFALAGRGGWVGGLLNSMYPLTRAHYVFAKYARRMDVSILDIGCGNGRFLELLSGVGFTNLLGIDPFIANDLERPGYSIRRRRLDEVTGRYDLVWLHHSFEHMREPCRELARIRDLMTPVGVCLITVPVLGRVFEEYRASSYIIQAPHHNFLFTVRSMQALSLRVSLVLDGYHRDAFGISNWLKLSDLWRRDISCAEIGSNVDVHFSRCELEGFRRIEDELVSGGLGDNVTFVFRRAA